MSSDAALVRPLDSARRLAELTSNVPIWVGEIEIHGHLDDIAVDPAYTAAALLVTANGVAVGQVVVPLTGGRAPSEAVRAAAWTELGREIERAAPPLRNVSTPITVVVPTRGRPERVARCIRSALRTDHPELAIVIVDNDPDDDRTALLVDAVGDERVTYVREGCRGTSAGRNRGLIEAASRGAQFVAFIDDDVEVDPAWAGRVAAALSEPGVACVCAPVLAAELT